MLYIQPLFYLESSTQKRSKFGYADDLCIMATSKSFTANCKTLSKDCQEVLSWAQAEEISFDMDKTELLHITWHRGNENPLIHIPDTDIVINPIDTKKSLRWLGIHLDHKLSFKAHVKTMAAKAQKAAASIRALSNTV